MTPNEYLEKLHNETMRNWTSARLRNAPEEHIKNIETKVRMQEMLMDMERELPKVKNQNERLLKMIDEERQKVAGYEQIAKIHSAYISILLNKLGAAKDSAITITGAEVTDAIERYETRALPAEEGAWSLYCEVIRGKDIDVQTEVTTAKREEKN